MKILSTIASAAILTVSMTAATQAAPVYFKDNLSFAGTGCPPGSTRVDNGNSEAITILFSEFEVGADSSYGRKRATCSFSVPVHVPQGYQVSTLKADWHGEATGKTRLQRKYFFAGQPNTPWLTSNFGSHFDNNFTKTDNLLHSTSTWSRCGRDVNLRIISKIRALRPNSYMNVGSLDLTNKVVFRLQWRRC